MSTSLIKPLLVGLATVAATPAFAATPCESVNGTKLEGGTITGAAVVAAGQYTAAGASAADKARFAKLPAFCQVNATLKPSPRSDIAIEVWLPISGWNGKLVEGGNSAFSPAFSYATMSNALDRGYAATSSDTGHKENNVDFALGNPDQLTDLGHRAVHVNAVAAKAITAAYYQAQVRAAFFFGCSTGGRQGYGAAQRYPDDFNGIVVGAPGINFVHQTGAELWIVKQVAANPASMMSAAKLRVLNAAVIKACDEIDGVKDGVIENSARCGYKPSALLCKGVEGPDCLTAAQIDLAEKIYQGPRFADGTQIFPGLARGTEKSWGFMLMRTEPLPYGLDAFRIIAKGDPNWTFRDFDLERDVREGDAKVGATMNNYDPDLRPFFARGGKLLGFHGWADSGNPAGNSIAYRQSVIDKVGQATTDRSYRLFLVPGFGHCQGGDSIDTVDYLSAIDAWVTSGKAPDSLPGSRVVDGVVVRTRPICPHPQEAVYKGTGSTDEAKNFTCAVRPAAAARSGA